MAYAQVNGLQVHYEVHGSGPPMIMMAPGAFDATIDKWSTTLVWSQVRPLETIAQKYMCIAYDRREAGLSEGRIEHISWSTYAAESAGLLDHLGIDSTFVIGGCMGASAAFAFAVAYPQRTRGLILHWPMGGVLLRKSGLKRFADHQEFAARNGLEAVMKAARETPSFWAEPSGGPWAPVIANYPEFAGSFAEQDMERYTALVGVIGRGLFDRDTAPGAEPEELLSLKVPTMIIPGHDANHATSAARYLEECIPDAMYHDLSLEEQTADRVRDLTTDFLDNLSK